MACRPAALWYSIRNGRPGHFSVHAGRFGDSPISTRTRIHGETDKSGRRMIRPRRRLREQVRTIELPDANLFIVVAECG